MRKRFITNGDSRFDDKEFTAKPYLKLIEDNEGATCICYQMRLHGKLHFVKKIKPEFKNDSRMRSAFRKENELGLSLSHPNIPRYVFIEGIFSPEEYVVSEWIEGERLDKFIVNNPKYFSDKKNIKRLIYQLTDALDYLHRNGIIHGDLKPSNIMLSKDGERAILIDFGYSISDAYTLTGGYTYDFAAPEFSKGESVTKAADYYSLGKIIEFVEKHTEGKQPKEILNLKQSLTHPQISSRIGTIEEIYSTFENKRGKLAWFTGLPILGLFVWFIVMAVFKDNSRVTDIDINQERIFKENINNTPTYPIPTETFQSAQPIYTKNDNKITVDKTEISKVNVEYEKENIKGEVNRLLKINYAPHLLRIDSLTLEKVFTMDWYLKIVNESTEAMGNSIKDSYYYEKYPSVPKDEVIYILSTEFNNFCNKIWNPKIENYYKNIQD